MKHTGGAMDLMRQPVVKSGRKRVVIRSILAGVGAVCVTAFAVREYPAIRREVKIWLM